MDTKPTVKNFVVIVLSSVLVVFAIVFLIMPKVRENREESNVSMVTNFEECVAAGNPVMESYPRQCRHNGQTFAEEIEPLIGGQRDEYGCLGPAGYGWSEEANACIREWELDENQKKAAKIAVDYIGYEKGLTIIQVQTAGCPSCFMVEVEKGKDRIKTTLENWEVVKKSMTPDECTTKGGEVVTTTGGVTCAEGKTNIGDVTGFISPAICCMEESEN